MSLPEAQLLAAFEARRPLVDESHEAAFRLFNGFTEGFPALALEVYAKTLVVHDHAESPRGDEPAARRALELVREQLPWLTAALWKVRHSANPEERNGRMLLGAEQDLARRVREHGVWYALALTLNRDSSLYLDTRALRQWAKAELAGKKVLNAFAYTGSLGVAAKAGGAAEVIHTDLKKPFLTVAKDSYAMNGWPVKKADFRAGDFFEVMGALKREDRLFDCVFIDPPFLSVTPKGRVDLESEMPRVLNKARPLVGHGGALVVVNNAVFTSGADFQAVLDAACADGYLSLDRRIDVPPDFVGYPGTRQGAPLVDPAPFNHSTKIAVLRVKRKDGRAA